MESDKLNEIIDISMKELINAENQSNQHDIMIKEQQQKLKTIKE